MITSIGYLYHWKTYEEVTKILLQESFNRGPMHFWEELDGIGVAVFSIGSQTHVFTDLWGMYPVFWDLEKHQVVDSMEFGEEDPEFLEWCKQNTFGSGVFFGSSLNKADLKKVWWSTPFSRYKLLRPRYYYHFEGNSIQVSKPISLLSANFPVENPIDVLRETMKSYYRRDFGDRILTLHLSAGLDSRLLFAILLDLGLPFKTMSAGEEGVFAQLLLQDWLPSSMDKEVLEDSDPSFQSAEEWIRKYACLLNGFGNPFDWAIRSSFKKSKNVGIQGLGGNETFGDVTLQVDPIHNFWATGFAHIRCITHKFHESVYPLLSRRFNLSCYLSGHTNRNISMKNWIKRLNRGLSRIPYFTTGSFPVRVEENRQLYNFNTRHRFVEIWYDEMRRIRDERSKQ